MSYTKDRMVIAVDFDGTIVEHRYPAIGKEIPFAIETLKKLQQEHHRIILWSVREGELLEEAVSYCREKGLEFYAVNKDYVEENESHNHFSRKIKADVFIDDRNVGGLPDWGVIYAMIHHKTSLRELCADVDFEADRKSKKKSFWSKLAALFND